MSFQPDADSAPVDLTANPEDSSRGGSRFGWSDPANRPRLIMLGIIAVLVVVILLLLTRPGGEPVPAELTPTPDDLAARPVSVSIKGTAFNIEPVAVREGRWQLVRAGADSAEWVYGTVINYVVGLYPTDATTALIAGLVAGD